MEIRINIPDRLAEEARAHGVSVEVYVQELLSRQNSTNEGDLQLAGVRAAIAQIRDLRKGNRLDGLQIKDLIHEGHKY